MGELDYSPRQLLKQCHDIYPDCWKAVDLLRSKADWPEWCFVPGDQAWRSVSGALIGPSRAAASLHSALSSLAAWRVTQGIYRFDQELYDELWQTILGPVPGAILRYLPEWCVYIELKSRFPRGVFVSLDCPTRGNQDRLRLLFDWDGTIEHLNGAGIGLGGFLPPAEEDHLDPTPAFELPNSTSESEMLKALQTNGSYMTTLIHGVVSLALYLCARNADLPRLRPQRPEAKRTKKGIRYFPPDKSWIWDVGLRVGPALRDAKQYSGDENEGGGTKPRAHVRRAHWHHYWTGPRKGTRELVLKWISPVLVNVDDFDELPAVIRPVE